MKAAALAAFLAAASCGLCIGIPSPPGSVECFGEWVSGGGANGALCGRSCAGRGAEPFHYSSGKCIGDTDKVLADALDACKATPYPGCELPACGKCAIFPENECKAGH
jgi:hypothetical protein